MSLKDRNSLAELERDIAFIGELKGDLDAAKAGGGALYADVTGKLDDWCDELEKMRDAIAQQMANLAAAPSCRNVGTEES